MSDRTRAAIEDKAISVPLDIKIELFVALVILMVASVATFMNQDSLRDIKMTQSYVNK